MIEDIDAIVLGDEEIEEDGPLNRINKTKVILIIAIIGWLLAIGEANWIYKHKDDSQGIVPKQTVTKLCALGEISTRQVECT